MCQADNTRKKYLPIFYYGCNLKRVSLLGVKSSTLPVDSLQSRGKQRHQPVGLSTTVRPYLIHAKASNKSVYSVETTYMQLSSVIHPQSNKNGGNLNHKGSTLVRLRKEKQISPRSLCYTQQGHSLLLILCKIYPTIGWVRIVTSLTDGYR